MFQRKIEEIFNNVQSVFGIADALLFVGYDIDGKDHDDTQQEVFKYADR